ncbi:MAG: LacI family DNA-binding transcriptional regulator, partial [Planctomycetota bacterium]
MKEFSLTKATTLQDVADRAGVSLATASLVLNNRPGISESTAETVRRAMDELAYAPPAPSRRRGTTAGRRRRAATGRIALLLAGQTAPEGLSWQVYMPLVDSLERGLQEHDLSLVLRRDEGLAPSTVKALKQQVDGLVCLGEADPEQARRLIYPFPCVWVMGRGLDQTWCDRVAIDDRRVGSLAAEYLLGRGHTRLGY